MLGFKQMPDSASSLFAAYASFATSMMMIRSITNDLLPPQLISFISSIFSYFFPSKSTPQTTLIIRKKFNYSKNQVYEAAEIYLRTKITPSIDRLKVTKTSRQHKVALSMEKDQEIVDDFQGIHLKWRFVSQKKEKDEHSKEKRQYELVFDKKFMDKVMDFSFPYILRRAKEIKEMENVSKLCSQNFSYNDDSGDDGCRGNWGSITLEHPATFDTLAMDPDLKKMIIDDLDRFVKRKEFYRKVGKAWKRGYLLYGPPGTGKSSLIAAMANHVKFDIYDLDLTDIGSNRELRESLISTTNRSILVIEDIDCSVNLQNREKSDDDEETNLEIPRSRLTLSGVLNFMDGLWSSCGDERIIVLTTNHKERLDPALLRPGRMDVHINLSYCTSKAFKVLATNYLGGGAIRHPLYVEIEGLIDDANVTPAEVAGELMKGDDVNMVMEGLAKFVKVKREEQTDENERPEEEEKMKPRKRSGGIRKYRGGLRIRNRGCRSPSRRWQLTKQS